MKTKKLLRRSRRAYEKSRWVRFIDCAPYRSKMIGRYGRYEHEYYWS